MVNSHDQFCGFISWNAAHVFPVDGNFSVYDPQTPLSDDEQAFFATTVFSNLKGLIRGKLSSGCQAALERLSCVTAYPECAMPGSSLSSISYFPPCRLQCEQVNTFCSTNLDCSGYPAVSCLVYVPTGYFLADPSVGPYGPLVVIYGISLTFWLIFSVIWNYLTFVKYRNSCVAFCRAVSGVPVIKSIVLTFGLAFWGTCNTWKMCSFWIGVSVVNTQLVYETAQMVVFLLIAKGWTITRIAFHPNEWRAMIVVMSAFYMVNSIVLVLQNTVLTVQGFWIANTVLYGAMYAYIYANVSVQLASLHRQVMMLKPEMPANIINPLKMKYRMYVAFLAMVLMSAVMEIAAHAIIFREGKYWKVLLAYEISNLCILGTIGVIFRPQEFSPFFFMVPARLNDERTRPIPIVEAAEDTTAGPEVDLAPLLNHPQGLVDAPGKMIIVKNPDSAVILALEVQGSAGVDDDADADNEDSSSGIAPVDEQEGRNLIGVHGETLEIDAGGGAPMRNNAGPLGLGFLQFGHNGRNRVMRVNDQEDDGIPIEHNQFLVRRRWWFF
jgi:hypothetical protein